MSNVLTVDGSGHEWLLRWDGIATRHTRSVWPVDVLMSFWWTGSASDMVNQLGLGKMLGKFKGAKSVLGMVDSGLSAAGLRGGAPFPPHRTPSPAVLQHRHVQTHATAHDMRWYLPAPS